MRRRAVLTLTAILVIVFLIQPLSEFAVADAPSYQLWIQSPAPWNRIYNTTTIEVKISATTYTSFNVVAIYYSLDGSSKKLLNQADSADSPGFFDYTAKGTLSNLVNGEHSLKAYALDSHGNTMSTERTFYVNTSHTYPTFILSPSNTSYSENNIPLELAINSLTNEDRLSIDYYSSLTIDYKLDNSSTHTEKGNSTLLGLSDGQHKITVTAYTWTPPNHPTLYSEQTTYFTVDTTKKEQTLDIANLITILAIIFSILAIGSIVAVIISRRRKKV